MSNMKNFLFWTALGMCLLAPKEAANLLHAGLDRGLEKAAVLAHSVRAGYEKVDQKIQTVEAEQTKQESDQAELQ